jgi:2-polyprenyl-6-methoxyphenol hydroxylase-like FAD-dependent oxidoreductase
MKNAVVCVLFLVIFLYSPPLFADKQATVKPLSVVVVGGGPAGLATAIEAHQNGAHVTIVEKRNCYSRLQWLLLSDSSLQLLEKWKVTPPQMRVVADRARGNIGIVQINHLEEPLAEKVRELGIEIIHGEFKELTDLSTMIVSTPTGALKITYDIIVGADGTHSNVREALAIPTHCMGVARGMGIIITLIPYQTHIAEEADISTPIKKDDHFIRRIAVPSTSIIFLQGATEISRKQLEKKAEEAGWHQDASMIAADKGYILDNIEVRLQQAQSFSDENKSAILVGDAAATASFFQGTGANTAFKTAAIAGDFFKNLQEHDETAYPAFNQAMQKTTNWMIEDSRYLFAKIMPE